MARSTNRKRASKKKLRNNPGKEYEVLLEQVVKGLNALEGAGLKNVRIERNVYLEEKTPDDKGQPMTRQIDLVWEFELAGMKYQTVFQAKNLKDKVERHHIDTFKTVLQDIPGNPKGVIVTKVGFDSGVLNYARHNGIGLYLLRAAEAADFAGGNIPSLDLQLKLYRRKLMRMRLIALHEPKDLNEYLSACKKSPDQLKFYDSHGVIIGTGVDLENDVRVPHNAGDGIHRVTQTFQQSAYIHTDSGKRFEVTTVRSIVSLTKLQDLSILSIVLYVFKLVTGDTSYTVDNEFTVRRISDSHSATATVDLQPHGYKGGMKVTAMITPAEGTAGTMSGALTLPIEQGYQKVSNSHPHLLSDAEFDLTDD